MKTAIVLSASLAALCGCASGIEGVKNYMSEDYYLNKEAELRKAYDLCRKRNGDAEAKCRKEKEDLLQQQEWNEMEESN